MRSKLVLIMETELCGEILIAALHKRHIPRWLSLMRAAFRQPRVM